MTILARLDPMGLGPDASAREYLTEANAIVARLPEATDVWALRRIIHEIFVEAFSATGADPEGRYTLVAQEVWGAYRRSPLDVPPPKPANIGPLVRFVCSSAREGIFGPAIDLSRDDRMTPSDRDALDALIEWFGEHLAMPDRLAVGKR